MSSAELAALFKKADEIDQLRKEQEDVMAEISKLQKKVQASPDILEKSGDAVIGKLRSLYVTAKDLAENEANGTAAFISQLEAIQQSGSVVQRKKIVQSRGYLSLLVYFCHKTYSKEILGVPSIITSEVGEQKKKRMKSDADISRIPPASMRSQLEQAASLKGEQAAARVTDDDAERAEWIVVKVIHFDREAKEFEVFDEEPGDDEETGQRRYKLPMSRIIPFPKRNDPSGAPDFQPGKHVLAVYPGTTALYKATVCPYHRKRKTDDYLLEFDDDEEEDGSLPQRPVAFHKVVPLPEGHRQ